MAAGLETLVSTTVIAHKPGVYRLKQDTRPDWKCLNSEKQSQCTCPSEPTALTISTPLRKAQILGRGQGTEREGTQRIHERYPAGSVPSPQHLDYSAGLVWLGNNLLIYKALQHLLQFSYKRRCSTTRSETYATNEQAKLSGCDITDFKDETPPQPSLFSKTFSFIYFAQNNLKKRSF